jgi:excisionase family DNA binding protein
MTPKVRFEDLPEVCTPQDLIRYLPIGRDGVYAALRTQAIRNTRLGQKFLIPKAAVRDFLGGEVE